jgi:hypothetical protein
MTSELIERLMLALVIGVGVTFTSIVLSFSGAVSDGVANILLWPATLLVCLIPKYNVGTAEEPFYEATPLHLLFWVAGMALCVPIYALLADVLIRRLKKGRRP